MNGDLPPCSIQVSMVWYLYTGITLLSSAVISYSMVHYSIKSKVKLSWYAILAPRERGDRAPTQSVPWH
jgi:hypothetical protein